MTGVFFSAVAAEADLHQAAFDRMRFCWLPPNCKRCHETFPGAGSFLQCLTTEAGGRGEGGGCFRVSLAWDPVVTMFLG